MQKLLFLLPFYVIRYEKSREDIEKDPEKLQKLLDEYVTISRRLEEEVNTETKEKIVICMLKRGKSTLEEIAADTQMPIEQVERIKKEQQL